MELRAAMWCFYVICSACVSYPCPCICVVYLDCRLLGIACLRCLYNITVRLCFWLVFNYCLHKHGQSVRSAAPGEVTQEPLLLLNLLHLSCKQKNAVSRDLNSVLLHYC